jgi:hypothetical protein
MTSVDDFLSGGSRYPLIKLNNPGSKLVWTDLIEARIVQSRNFDTGQPEYWDNDPNKPKQQIVLDVRIDWAASQDITVGADGAQESVGSYYVRYACQIALQDACMAAGCKLSEVGRGAIARTADGIPKRAGANPPQQFAAQVQRRVASSTVDDLLGGTTHDPVPPTTPAPQQQRPTSLLGN